jgi:predicted TIM-barrel fold metal-dependent hydrolase
LRQALDVLGPDRLMVGVDDPYSSAGYTVAVGAREFVDAAPLSAQDKAKVAHLNAERLLKIRKLPSTLSLPSE